MAEDTDAPDTAADVPADVPEDAGDDDVVAEAEVVADGASGADTTDADAGADAPQAAAEGVERERDDYRDALIQLQADFENFRKRSLKQQGDAIEHATGRLVEELLPVLDACDAGIEHGDDGVTAIFASLLGVLEKAGLQRLDPIDQPFDPNAHEAVMHEPAAEADEDHGPVVAEVMRAGYVWKGRTLRAAMVKVRG